MLGNHNIVFVSFHSKIEFTHKLVIPSAKIRYKQTRSASRVKNKCTIMLLLHTSDDDISFVTGLLVEIVVEIGVGGWVTLMQ